MSASMGTQSDSFAQDGDAALLATIADSPSQRPSSASCTRASPDSSDQMRTHEPRSDSQSHSSSQPADGDDFPSAHRATTSRASNSPAAGDGALPNRHVTDTSIEGLVRSARANCEARQHSDDLARAYEEVVQWRRNLYIVPYGSAGQAFVEELAHIIEQFVDGGERQADSWKSVTVACQLLLQRPRHEDTNSTASHHLRRRLAAWHSNDFMTLLEEGRCIQAHLPTHSPASARSISDDDLDDTKFSNLVFNGKIQSAIRMVTGRSSGGVLGMDDVVDEADGRSVRDILRSKHPSPTQPPASALLDGEGPAIHHIMFERLTPEMIKKVARNMHGSAGPSGVDADGWKKMLTCYTTASNRLCSALARAARHLCTVNLEGTDLTALTAARLIPLDKRPGIRPIAVGEVHRRIICKAVMKVIEWDVRKVTAPLQLCVGIPSACEAAVHSMEKALMQQDVQGLLLVDASNAFNSLNRQAALHNVPIICPALGRVFANTYSTPSRLFVSGGGEVRSREGTCQGDPLAMAIYAVATMPLAHHLADRCPNVLQTWYADDDAAAGSLCDLRHYWSEVFATGPGYGYQPNAQKSVILVKPEHEAEAAQLFQDTGVNVVTSGCHYLGCPLGSEAFCQSSVAATVAGWQADVRKLSTLAKTQPHAAYTVLVRGIVAQWRYTLRTSHCPPEVFNELDNLINTQLLPGLVGRALNSDEPIRQLVALPTRFGGLHIPLLSADACRESDTSRKVTAPLVGLIAPDPAAPSALAGESSSMEPTAQSTPAPEPAASPPDPEATGPALESTVPPPDRISIAIRDSRFAAGEARQAWNQAMSAKVQDVLPHLTPPQQLLTEVASTKGVSSWLTASPTFSHRTVLNKADFRDAVCLRYGFPPEGLSTSCVCGADFTVDHAMTCASGGYPSARHDEVRDVLAEALKEVSRDVETEPILLAYEDENLAGRSANRAPDARLDIRARGFWTRQQDAFFDVRITHPKASLLSRREVLRQLKGNEREKKRQYAQRVNTVDHGSFTPLVFATNGMVAPECSFFLKSLVNVIVERNADLTYATVMNRLRCKLSFCLLRWSITSLRGCRASYHRSRPQRFLQECRQLASQSVA